MPKHKQVTTCLREKGAPTSDYCSCPHCTLAVCSICGCYEGSLTTDCPGVPVDQAQQDRIYKDGADYVDGTGWYFSIVRKEPRFEDKVLPTPKKEKKMPSVLQPWVMELPLRAQGTILTGVRGCDFAPKNPLTNDERYPCSTGEDTVERKLVAFFRYCTLVPADEREINVPGAWFQAEPPATWKPSQLTHYPLHWYAHLMHCFEVVGHLRPTNTPEVWVKMRSQRRSEFCTLAALAIYTKLAEHLHLNVETKDQLVKRLTEDRILSGTVVS